MRNRLKGLLAFSWLLLIFSFFSFINGRKEKVNTAIQKNNVPVVKILSPENNSSFLENTMISYSISVSDKEDGESKYQEIPDHEVFLEIRSFPDRTKATAYINRGMQKDHPGLLAIKNSDCFNCHAVKTKLSGPSFEEINKRYSKKSTSMVLLAEHIKNGTSENWGPVIMPAHPQLSDKEAMSIAQWILEKSADPDVDLQRGTEGAFWTKLSATHKTNGALLLTASYQDHGTDENKSQALTGQSSSILTVNKK